MAPKKFNPEKLMKQKPISLGNNIGGKISVVKELQSEIEKIKKQNSEIQKQIEEYESESLETIKKYREIIDAKTTDMNDRKNKAERLRAETEQKKRELLDENEKAKENVRIENDKVCEDIKTIEQALQVIHDFEQNKQKILDSIHHFENQIETTKRTTEDEIEKTKANNAAAEARFISQNEIELENAKNKIYAQLIASTDQAILLHIQRRNNLDTDLRSLEEMREKYKSKIDDREKQNARLKDTIEQLHKDQLIDESAQQRKQIATLKKELNESRRQLIENSEKAKIEYEEQETKRAEEANKMELSLRLQQDQLDHKLQQISALRELALTVLSYRSQLEAEFITVLGEVIYEVAQRENPGVQISQSRATRKLVSTSLTNSAASGTLKNVQKGKEVSINHTLSQFTMEDRIMVLQRFIDRVQASVDEKNEKSGDSSSRFLKGE